MNNILEFVNNKKEGLYTLERKLLTVNDIKKLDELNVVYFFSLDKNFKYNNENIYYCTNCERKYPDNIFKDNITYKCVKCKNPIQPTDIFTSLPIKNMINITWDKNFHIPKN